MPEAGHLRGEQLPEGVPVLVVFLGAVVDEVAAEVPSEVQGGDAAEAVGKDAFGEEEKGAELVDVEGVGGVEDADCFHVDLPAGLEKC